MISSKNVNLNQNEIDDYIILLEKLACGPAFLVSWGDTDGTSAVADAFSRLFL